MERKIIWTVISCIMVLSLVIASCGTKDIGGTVTQEDQGQTITVGGEEEKMEEEDEEIPVSSDDPQYGGTLSLALLADPQSQWDLLSLGTPAPAQLSHQRVWDGDWTKGRAGGYGTGEVTWGTGSYIPDLQTGFLAESVEWIVDDDGQNVTTYIKVRPGVDWALDQTNEASRLVGGRELTTDDIVWNLDQRMNNDKAMNWQLFPQIRGMHAVKTGPYEIEVTHPLFEHLEGAMRLLNSVMIAPEVYEQYGDDSLYDWRYDVGNGPYYIADLVAANTVTLERNPNYWMEDPIGPGTGNQLPYIEKFKYVIIQDLSTRQAALRTGKIDQMPGLTLEDKDLLSTQTPELMAAQGTTGLVSPMFMRTDLEPFNNKNVRRALMMATDFNEINQGLYSGLGDIVSWPYRYTPEYADLYLGLDDPECPESVKELYTYNPDKARQLLADAGYPTGFKTSVVLTGQEGAEYYSIVKDQWSKVGVDLEIEQVADAGALIGVAASVSYEGLISIFFSPPFTYPEQAQYTTGTGWLNASLISDPYIDKQAEEAKVVGITDFRAAMAITKELMKYVLDQAYCIPTPAYPNYVLWWPWLKNYSGELSVGYAPGDSWVQYVWIDQDLKKEMGY